MKSIVFLDWDDLYTIVSMVSCCHDCKKELLEKHSDEFTPDDLSELADSVSNLSRIESVLASYLTKGIAFDESCLPDLESDLPKLISDYIIGGEADEK